MTTLTDNTAYLLLGHPVGGLDGTQKMQTYKRMYLLYMHEIDRC